VIATRAALSTCQVRCWHYLPVESIRAIVVETEWSELEHAYGDASDAPFQLLALLGEDLQARSGAVGYLDAAILHQGTVCSATGPVARAVAAMLDDPRTLEPVEDVLPWDPEPRPLRVALLDFLTLVAQACWFDVSDTELLADAYPEGRDEADLQRMKTEERAARQQLGPDPSTRLLVDKVPIPPAMAAAAADKEYGRAMEARDLLSCRAAVPEIFQALSPFLHDPDETISAKALEAAAQLAGHAELASARPAIATRLEAAAIACPDPWQRAADTRLLGTLGARSDVLLADEHPGVRACAALAPASTGDPRATREILAALQTPAAADRWFTPNLPGQDDRFRFELVRAAIDRVPDFETLLPAALAIVPVSGPLTTDSDWGPLLLAAFPHPYEQGTQLSPAQRSYLSALVDHEVIWDPRAGDNVSTWLGKAGLPHDRGQCRTIATH
jgi:hypothetical protein